MDLEQKLELARLRDAQRDLMVRFDELERRLGAFEKIAVSKPAPSLAPEKAPVFVPSPVVMPEPEPPASVADAIEQPPPLPVMPPPVVPAPLPTPEPVKSLEAMLAKPASPPPLPSNAAAPVAPPPVAPTAKKETDNSLEMQIGSVWLVRAAIFMILTSLVFGGSYLYQSVIPHLGPASKVGLLYLAAGALTGLGFWLERSRQARESSGLVNYARVVLGGGLAAVYYVTFAAHHFENLRVIGSPVLAGALLLGWTGFMTWLADRRNSQTLAAFSILLAYYTSATSDVAAFNLFANLILTAAAVFLLQRRRWTAFSFASMVATFGSYAYWRYGDWLFAWSGSPLVTRGSAWQEVAFLTCYWALFTFAAFFDKAESLDSPARKSSFISLNNGAFFALSSIAIRVDYPGAFWKWSLLCGVVLVALGELGRRMKRPLDARTIDAYYFEGLGLITLGIIFYYSGWQLSLMLAIESAVIMAAAGRRESRLLLWTALIVALLSFFGALVQIAYHWGASNWWLTGLCGGAIMVFNAWWSQRLREETPEEARKTRPFAKTLYFAVGSFSFLGLAIWLALLEERITDETWRAPLIALAAVALTASVYGVRIVPMAFFAQFYLVAAFLHWMWFYDNPDHSLTIPLWNPLILLGSTLALGHWHDRERRFIYFPWASGFFAGLNAFGAACLLGWWLAPRFELTNWVAVAPLLSFALLGYGLYTGYKKLSVAGQVLLLAGVLALMALAEKAEETRYAARWLAVSPLAAMLAMIAMGKWLVPPAPGRENSRGVIAGIYEICALVVFLLWGFYFFPRWEQFPVFTVGGALMFAAGCWQREKRWLLWSAIATGLGLAIFWIPYSGTERGYWIQLIGIIAIAAQQQAGRHLAPDAQWIPPKTQEALITAATLCGWAWVSHRVSGGDRSGAFTVAASWSIFAAVVFALGLALRERTYRWLGLIILGCTLAHVAIIDIWQLNVLQRFLSALVLGIVLLAIGFFYNRYQAKLKNWFSQIKGGVSSKRKPSFAGRRRLDEIKLPI